jgi:hypothetical protein
MTKLKRWPDWTQEEDAILREHYPQGGKRAVASLLLGRTLDAIGYRVKVLGIKAGNVKPVFRGRQCERRQVTEKTCTQCHAVKPLDGFPLAKKGLGGRAAWCKACNAEWFRANVPREEATRRVRECRARKRAAQVLETV